MSLIIIEGINSLEILPKKNSRVNGIHAPWLAEYDGRMEKMRNANWFPFKGER